MNIYDGVSRTFLEQVFLFFHKTKRKKYGLHVVALVSEQCTKLIAGLISAHFISVLRKVFTLQISVEMPQRSHPAVMRGKKMLILTAPSKIAGDDTFIFLVLSLKKIRLDVSCDSSARQRIHMKYQVFVFLGFFLFFSEKKKKKTMKKYL